MQHCPDDSDYVSSYSRSQRLVELLHVEVVMLTNMVGKGEIDEDLADETKDEAGKYGEIKSVNCVDVPNARDDQAVRIFINFSTAESATKALLGFNGRFFGGRTVLARFFSPDLYDKGDYLADPQAG